MFGVDVKGVDKHQAIMRSLSQYDIFLHMSPSHPFRINVCDCVCSLLQMLAVNFVKLRWIAKTL